ncbi:MAG: glycosyltransferase family 2 protein [Anaerolineales bacterium]|nr:glycosyltransferase family 2 protein [Anaerolineales bacterium]
MTAAPSTSVSLIIPTYRRAERLAETLRAAALAAASLSSGAFEVVVVDDAPGDATRQVVQYGPLPGARYLPSQRQGATRARNFGAQQAQGGLFVFLDDDIELGPESLARLVQAHGAHPHGVIVGTLYTPDQPVRQEAGLAPTPFTECYTGLLSVPAAEFAALGGFRDVTGGWPNWDDVEFGYRVTQAGLPLRRCLDAWAIHHDASAQSLAATARRSQAAARAAARLFQAHPGMQGQLPMFADKGPVNWRADRPRLIARKLLRRLMSQWPLLRALETLEPGVPPARDALRRWIVGGYIWQGYRQGLRELR